MARVIDEQTPNIAKCRYCGKLIEYSQSDKKSDYDYTPFGTVHYEYIICPNCKQQILL